MVIHIGVDEDNRVIGWSSTPAENTIEFTIPDGHSFLDDNPFSYYLIDNQLVKDRQLEIETIKEVVDMNLSIECERNILSGFTFEVDGIPYHFSYDKEAQTNIHDTVYLFDNNMIDKVKWNGRLRGKRGPVVRLEMDKALFEQFYVASTLHKLKMISIYRDDLTPLMNQAKTIEELTNITWTDAGEPSFDQDISNEQKLARLVKIAQDKANKVEGDSDYLMMAIFDLADLILGGHF